MSLLEKACSTARLLDRWAKALEGGPEYYLAGPLRREAARIRVEIRAELARIDCKLQDEGIGSGHARKSILEALEKEFCG